MTPDNGEQKSKRQTFQQETNSRWDTPFLPPSNDTNRDQQEDGGIFRDCCGGTGQKKRQKGKDKEANGGSLFCGTASRFLMSVWLIHRVWRPRGPA